jgi:CRISPR type I-E-associated protein CasB/Cse2
MELVVRLDSRHPDSQVRIARLASLLAHIRADNRQQRVAAALRGNDPDRPLMSAIRFRRLLLSESGEELFTGLRRAISMLDHRADVRDIAHTWLYWDHPELGEKVRIKWALTYAGGSIERNRLDATHVNQSGD